MAVIDNLTPDQQRELNSLLEKEVSTRERIAEINKRIATAVGQERQNLQNLINQERQRITNNAQRIAQLKKIKEGAEYEEKIFQSISGINEHIKKQISGQTTSTNTLANVTTMLVNLKKDEMTASEADAKLLAARRETLEGIALKTIDLAKQADAHHHHSETSAQKREKFQRSIAHLTAQEKEEAETLYEVHERLEQKLERQHALHEQMHAVMHHLPGPISEALDFTKGMVANIGKGVLLTGLLAAGLMAGLHAFMEMDEAAAGYKEKTGFTNNMTKEIDYTVHHTGLEYRKMGVTMADAYDVMNELANSQSDMFHFAQGTVDSLSLMKATMGISTQDSAAIQASFEQIGGLSEATAANTQMMAAKLAEGVGVSPAEMFKDMSKSAGVLSKHMKGNVQLFIQSAAKAKMLGTTLEDAGSHAEKLLDFESGIEAELVAATFVGGQFNLSRARALAYEGDILGAQQATLDALEQSGDFTKQDYHTKKALAAAAGMEVEEIEKQLGIRDKLGKMSGKTLENAQALIDSGVDISNLNDDQLKKKAEEFATQQRIVSQMDEFKNAIAGSVEQIGGRMLPAFQALMPILVMMADVFGTIAKVIGYIASSTAGLVGFFGTLVTLTAMIYANKVKTFALAKMQAIADAQAAGKSMLGAVASIFSGQGKLPIIGAVIAATMVGALFAAASKASSFGDDVFSPGAGSSGYGSRTLMGPEGAIQLNNKDSVIAGTDLFSKQTQSQPSPVQTVSPMASSNNSMINALISEFRGVRADMASGKIGVYMDSERVTSNVTRTIDNSTRNNFALV
jgi:tRNA-binding EMAP/Myf-like protein